MRGILKEIRMADGIIVKRFHKCDGVRVPEGAVFTKFYRQDYNGMYYVPNDEAIKGGAYGKKDFMGLYFRDDEVEEFSTE